MSIPRGGALSPFSVGCRSGTSSDKGRSIPWRRCSVQILEDKLIEGIPGEPDVGVSMVEESGYLFGEEVDDGRGFCFPWLFVLAWR